MNVTHTSPEDTTCEFTLRHESTVSTLQIAVHTMTSASQEFPAYLAKCGTDNIPLKAVGNEALECILNGGSVQVTEQIVGRVRDRAFLIRWTMPKSREEATSQDDIREKLRNVAEQVAGSLF
jgi:hypothetical protein